jgi:hypothetical protein
MILVPLGPSEPFANTSKMVYFKEEGNEVKRNFVNNLLMYF